MKKESGQGRIPPNDTEAEKAILCAMLIDRNAAEDALQKVQSADFYLDAHKKIFDAMRALNNVNQPVDIVTVRDKLEREGTLEQAGGFKYLTYLSTYLPSSANNAHYIELLIRDSILRRLISTSAEIADKCFDADNAEECLAYAESNVLKISQDREKSQLEQIGTATGEVIDRLERAMSDKNALFGLETGFPNLDRITNGLQRSDLILLAARPACGKTSFALNIAANLARIAPKTVIAVFSLEMPKSQLAQRMVCNMAKVSMSDAVRGEIDAETDFPKIFKASEILAESDIYIDDTSLIRPSEILSKCRRLKKTKGKLDLVIIDYLQLMNPPEKKDSRQQEISDISRNMKIIAKELQVPLILLSQLSRAVEGRKDKKPMLSDLRESGAIEQDADIVMFLHRTLSEEESDENDQEPLINLNIEKHRNGATGELNFKFVKNCVRFEPVQVTRDEKGKVIGYKNMESFQKKNSDIAGAFSGAVKEESMVQRGYEEVAAAYEEGDFSPAAFDGEFQPSPPEDDARPPEDENDLGY